MFHALTFIAAQKTSVSRARAKVSAQSAVGSLPLSNPSRAPDTPFLWHQGRNRMVRIERKKDFYERLLAQHLAECNPDPKVPSVDFQLHGAETLSCGWDRFWIQSLDANGRPRCRGGDFYTLRVQSEQMKLSVDRLVDLGNGLYEGLLWLPQFNAASLVAKDPIEICADLTMTNTLFRTESGGWMDHFAINASTLGSVFRLPHYLYLGHDATRSSCVPRKNSMSAFCVKSSKYMCEGEGGGTVVPETERILPLCGRQHPIVPGAWLRQSPHPDWPHPYWYYPKDCRLRYLDPAGSRACLKGLWIAGWGESTMKQAMSNFVEEHLNLSVVEGVYMRNIGISNKKSLHLLKYINFFTYRQWDRTFADVRISMVWGGCRGWVSGAPGCPEVAMRNRDYLEGLLKGPGKLPDMISMSHHIWTRMSPPFHDEVDFIALIKTTVDWIHSHYDARRQTRPLLLWNNYPKVANDRDFNRCRYPAETYEQHLSWAIEDALSEAKSPLVFIDRWALTAPFHIDSDGFVHTGVHYGSTFAMCMTGLGHKKIYEPASCVRQTYPETVMVQSWLNMLCNT